MRAYLIGGRAAHQLYEVHYTCNHLDVAIPKCFEPVFSAEVTTTIDRERYTKRKFYSDGQVVCIFAQENMTDFEAIMELLESYVKIK